VDNRHVAAIISQRRPATVSWVLVGLTLLVLAIVLVLVGLNVDGGKLNAGRTLFYALGALAVISYAGIGSLIARRLPGNAIGWLLCVIGLLIALSMLAEQYSLLGLATDPGSVPAPRQVGLPASSFTILAIILLILLVLLFPDGRLPSRRWRPVRWAVYVIAVCAVLQELQRGTTIQGGLTNALSAVGVAYPNPVGVLPRHGWFSDLLAVAAIVAIVTVLLTIVSVFARRRLATPEVRQQLAWLGYVGVLTIGFVLLLVTGGLIDNGANSWIGTLLWSLMLLTPLVGIPVACAVAVLRYRLYDLDVVVRKTVVAALVAAGFTGIYALLVVGVGAATGRSSDSALTFAAAAVAAVVFQPLRARAGLLADRLVYGKRASPYEVLSQFAEQIAGTQSTDEVLPSMARMVAEATGAERTEIWLRSGGDRLEAAWPLSADPAMARPAQVADRTRIFPVEHRGEALGELRVTCSLREPLTPGGERLVREVAAQAGLVLRNVALIEDLRSSRQRIVTAADEARREIERNLHDGAQQQLVALRITLGLVRQASADASGEISEMLAETERQAEQALADLRDLAHGIYPPLLADRGLRLALESQARKSAVPVEVEAESSGRYSQDVEAAVYFSVLEALQNVVKYARATRARVTVGQDGQWLTFAVADDGAGFDPATTPPGSGIQGITDRLAALGGALQVVSAPGRGTTVTGYVPVPATETAPVAAQLKLVRTWPDGAVLSS